MARPYFTGNYGSSLAKVDTRPIIEAGRATGQMYAQAGQDVGGMIKEYGLNKQKREVMTDKIEGTLNLYPEYATQLTSSGDETSDKKNQTTLDKLAKGELGVSALEGLAEKLSMMELKDEKEQKTQIAEQNQRLVEENITRAERENKFARDTEAHRSDILEDQAILSRLNRELQETLDPKKRELLLAQQRETIADLGLGPEARRQKRKEWQAADVQRSEFPPALQARYRKNIVTANLAHINAQIADLKKKTANYGELTELQQAQLDHLKAEALKFEAEEAAIREQLKGVQEIVDPKTPGVDEPSAFEVDPKLGAQGDLAGQLKGTINWLGDYLFGYTHFEGDKDAKARVNALRMQLMPAFIGTLSDRGAEWALKEVEDIIPGVNDSDGQFRSKMQQLPSILAKKLEVDKKTVKLGMGTLAQRLQAAQNAQQFPALIESLNEILEQDANKGEALTEEELLKKYTR